MMNHKLNKLKKEGIKISKELNPETIVPFEFRMQTNMKTVKMINELFLMKKDSFLSFPNALDIMTSHTLAYDTDKLRAWVKKNKIKQSDYNKMIETAIIDLFAYTDSILAIDEVELSGKQKIDIIEEVIKGLNITPSEDNTKLYFGDVKPLFEEEEDCTNVALIHAMLCKLGHVKPMKGDE